MLPDGRDDRIGVVAGDRADHRDRVAVAEAALPYLVAAGRAVEQRRRPAGTELVCAAVVERAGEPLRGGQVGPVDHGVGGRQRRLDQVLRLD